MSSEPVFGFRPSNQPRYPWGRLETLMDGIIAIAATLLVLDSTSRRHTSRAS